MQLYFGHLCSFAIWV